MGMNAFDLIKSPLMGVNLIEAGAGTGKTYTIAGLYLRLVLEKHLPVESILVVTFTEAATQELKERIRSRLKEALSAFDAGGSDDALLSELIRTSENHNVAKDLLERALRDFDQAAVFTIHGFCQRMLVENAFESGSLFDTELVTDTKALFRQVMTDYYRLHVYPQPPLFLGYLASKGVGPETFERFVGQVLKPGMRLIPDLSWAETGEAEKDLLASYTRLRDAWASGRETAIRSLMEDPGLKRNMYKASSISGWTSPMDRFLVSGRDPLALPGCLEKFTGTNLSRAVKKGHEPPQHPVFDAAGVFHNAYVTLAARYANNLLCLTAGGLSYADRQMALIKDEQGIMGFDDLLIRLYQGVTGPMGPRLAGQIRETFAAALIDEFQDTDPIQYGIFSRVFAVDHRPFFMIGDPKQAIYSFRGADIFAYMDAAGRADSRYSLGCNYRSDEGLVRAVNTLFKVSDNPFVFEAISFESAEPAAARSGELLSENGKTLPPFQLWLLDGPEEALTKGRAARLAEQAVAREIRRLIDLGRDGNALLGDRPVCERDMAVLVRTNREAQSIKQTLTLFGIPSVIYDTGNVFDSDEAEELQRILSAMARPADDGLLKAALATECLGLGACEIAVFENDPGGLDIWSDRFREYLRLWQRKGFIEAFNALVKDCDVRARLMGHGQGERKNTNLSHLAQLLHQASLAGKASPERLLAWLDMRIHEDASSEEHQLRLESDDEAVRIVTIHKSKGMEYPLVFCPSVWNARVPKDPGFCVFHDPETRRPVCDVGSNEYANHRALALRESLAEDLRLLYVALTRAKNRCYAVWGRVKGTGGSAMAYLLNDGALPDDEAKLAAIAKELETQSGGQIQALRISGVEIGQAGDRERKDVPLSVRTFGRRIETRYRITSFSALSARKSHPADDADRDALSTRAGSFHTPDPDGEKTIFTFPKGAAPGTFLHDVFEHADFTADQEEIAALIAGKLSDYGYDPLWKDCISGMVRNVLAAPLSTEDTGFTLSTVSGKFRLNELEFYYPLDTLEPQALEKVLERHGVNGFGACEKQRLSFSPVQGFLKGYIDLVFSRKDGGVERFYIVDWKSNYLGDSPSDYGPDTLTRVMAEEHYVLQYHLYVLALHRYLALTLGEAYRYEQHFGGVFYLFLRGVCPSFPQHGVFTDRPSQALVQDLSKLLWGS